MGPARVSSSLDLRPHRGFTARADVLRPADGYAPSWVNQVRLFVRIMADGLRGRPLVLYSSWGAGKPDLLALVLLGMLPERRRPATVLVGEMWQPTPGRQRWERLVVRLADRGVGRYLVLSQAEAELFPLSWPVAPEKVRVRRFYFAPHEHGLKSDERGSLGDYVFSGGDSFRDYTALLEAARRMPDTRFLLVTKVLDGDDLPDNVELRTAPYSEYVSLMRGAGAVVVPVQRGLRRSAGLLTFVMAMWLEKPTVVTDVLAVDEYLEHGRTGLLVDGSVEGYVDALRRVLDPSRAGPTAAMGASARAEVVGHLSFEAYVEGILGELDAEIRSRRAPGAAAR